MKKPVRMSINSCTIWFTVCTSKQYSKPSRLDTVHFPLQISSLCGSVTRDVELNELYLLYLASNGFGQLKTWARACPLLAGLDVGRDYSPTTTPSSYREALSYSFTPPNTALYSSERPLALLGLRVTVCVMAAGPGTSLLRFLITPPMTL